MVKVSYTDKDGKMSASSITMVKAPSKAPAEKTTRSKHWFVTL